MNLKKLENYTISSESALKCDLLVIYDCHESRSSNVRNNVIIDADKTFTIIDKSSALFSKPDELNSDHHRSMDTLSAALESQLGSREDNYKVVIDISCIPRNAMAELLACLVNKATHEQIELIVLYSLAEFTPPSKNELANLSIEPVHKFFAGWSTPEIKPTSLILGLGYEPDKAEGASEYFEPSDQWVFIPKSPVVEFFGQVNKNNFNLIQETDENHLIEYNVADPEMTYGQLELVISSLTRTSNPVLLPFGPKIFFFLCLIQCLTHPELGVWQVTSKETPSQIEIKASGYIIGIRCLFS